MIIFAFDIQAKVTHATSGGNWSNASIWDNGVPACGDSIYIDKDSEVDVNINVQLDEASACSTAIYLEVSGTLQFSGGRKMYLSCGSHVFITNDGEIKKNGGGSSNLINICNTTVWSAGDGNLNGPAPVGPGLPIELISFNANVKEDYVELLWTTASEINNDYFTVERSKDLVDFTLIKNVKGSGNSREVRNYITLDEDPDLGILYYRLKQTDYDGAFSYSDIVVAEFNEVNASIHVYPTYVVGSYVTVSIPNDYEQIEMWVVSSNGQELLKKMSFSSTKSPILLDLSAISYHGSALLFIQSKNRLFHQRLVLNP